jgi:DNA-binding transcriptional MerR regulator
MSQTPSDALNPGQAGAEALPPIPAKRYFTVDEVAALCAVKPHVLRHWELEFTQLRQGRKGVQRRNYQHHEVLLIRSIRQMLYQEGASIASVHGRLEYLAVRQAEDVQAALELRKEMQQVKRELQDILRELQG